MSDNEKAKKHSMWDKIDKKSTEIFCLHFVLALSGLVTSFWYTYKSFYGLFNPYFYFTAITFDGVLNKPGFFPKDIQGLQAMWDQPLQDSIMPMQTFFIGMLMLVLGGATLLTCFDISNKMQQFMLKSYVKLRFGSEYYSVWMFTQRMKWFEHYQNEKNEKEKELEPLKKAELEHFEEWKKYHKSSLTFSEWKQKILNAEMQVKGK
ncbi:hypothetical protein EWD79_22310 [Salmonella enterica subsp. enterica serovar Java]|nr:hypothetical protein [Salmonella enterica]ECE8552353.1 hypothetical protein [Salmonella enterica subsp. enterica serovar Java]